jgi:hypothetical protein
MVGTLWSQTDARSVIEPQAPPFGLFCRDLQPLTPPDALNALLVHHPTSPAKQRRDPPIAVWPAGPRAAFAGKMAIFARHRRCRNSVKLDHFVGTLAPPSS